MIEVKHPNGCVGKLKGHDLTIYRDDGKELWHTYKSTCNTEEDVYRLLEETPRLLEMVRVIHD